MMLPLDMLNEPAWQRLAWTLLHFVWQGLAVAAGVTLLRLLVPWRRAQARYVLYLAGLLLMAACPLVTFALVQAPTPAEAPGPAGQATDVPELVTGQPGEGEPTARVAPRTEALLPGETTSIRQATAAREQGEQTASDIAAPVPGLEAASWVARIDESVRFVQPYGLAVWMVGVFLLGMRLLLSFGGIRWLIRNRRPISAELASRAVELGNRFGLRRVPEVLVCERIREAIVVGVLRPMILLPGCWMMEMTPAVLEAVIAHELAHIRRWDTWVNLLQRLAETLLFYHPAVWWLSHRLSLEREMCTDELAVEATGQRMTYATTLELLGRKRLNLARAQFGVAIGGSRMALLDRVRNVLGMSPSSERARWWPVGVLVLLVPVAMVLAGTTGRPAGADSSENEGELSAMSREPDMRAVGDSPEGPAAPATDEYTLAGQVLDDRGEPVVGAYVVVYDQKSGIPLMQEDYELLTEHLQRRGGKSNLAHAITDDKGGFHLKRVPAGQYRLVAQSWEGASGGQNLLDITSKVVHLRGVAERVRVSPESSETTILRPLGNGTLQIDDNTKDYLEYYPEYDGIGAVLNKQMFLLVVSKSPLKADPILGFPAWGGAFLQGALGATRKPPGKMTIRGLPRGRVHVALGFWSDQDSGFAAAEAEIRPKATANLRIPIMARWAKERFRPPQRLVPLAEAVEDFGRKLSAKVSSEARPYAYMQMVMKANGISFRPQEGDYVLHGLREIARHRDREVRLPRGGKATFADVMAACQYIDLARQHRERSKRPGTDGAPSENSTEETNSSSAGDSARGRTAATHRPGQMLEGWQWRDKSRGRIWDNVRRLWLEVNQEGEVIEVTFAHQVTDAALELLKRLPNLRSITCGNTAALIRHDLTDAKLERLKGLANLRNLDLQRSRITDVGMVHLRALKRLESLSLADTQVGDRGLELLEAFGWNPVYGDVPLLKSLNLNRTRVTDAGLKELMKYRRLKSLSLEQTQVTGAGLAHLQTLTGLEELNLTRTKVSDAGLAQLPRVKALSLDGTRVGDAGMAVLGGFWRLRSLSLSGTDVTDAGLESLKGLQRRLELRAGHPDLASLSLRNTRITDAGVEHLAFFTNLKELDLRRTEVTPEGVKRLQQALPNTEILR